MRHIAATSYATHCCDVICDSPRAGRLAVTSYVTAGAQDIAQSSNLQTCTPRRKTLSRQKGNSNQNPSFTHWGENNGALILMAVFQDFMWEVPLIILINATHLYWYKTQMIVITLKNIDIVSGYWRSRRRNQLVASSYIQYRSKFTDFPWKLIWWRLHQYWRTESKLSSKNWSNWQG